MLTKGKKRLAFVQELRRQVDLAQEEYSAQCRKQDANDYGTDRYIDTQQAIYLQIGIIRGLEKALELVRRDDKQ